MTDRTPRGLFATPEQTSTPPTPDHDDDDDETPEETALRELRANLFPTNTKENDNV
jgi:hypothetical protein